MAQDDHKQRSGNSSCGSGSNKSSKKTKPKKVPQRGLGVAQLEKLRLEEQQKKDVLQTVLQNNPVLAPNFRQNPPSHIDQPSPTIIYKTNHGLPNSDPAVFPKSMNNMGHGSWGKVWNGEPVLEGESYRYDESGRFGYRPNPSLIYESVPVLHGPSGIPRKELFPQQHSSSPVVKVPSGPSPSVLTFNQMEPPSNQSFYNKIFTPKWPEEEKMVGMKRSYPFSLDNPPGPSFPCRLPPVHAQYPAFRSAESASFGNGGITHVEPPNPLSRQGSASLNVMPAMRAEKVTKQTGDLNGDFLTLALPKPPKPEAAVESGPSLQGNADEPNTHNFFPSSNAVNGNTITSSSGEVVEKLDLNLKL